MIKYISTTEDNLERDNVFTSHGCTFHFLPRQIEIYLDKVVFYVFDRFHSGNI